MIISKYMKILVRVKKDFWFRKRALKISHTIIGIDFNNSERS